MNAAQALMLRYNLDVVGTAERVRRRSPEITERIVLVTESGELTLSAADRAAVVAGFDQVRGKRVA